MPEFTLTIRTDSAEEAPHHRIAGLLHKAAMATSTSAASTRALRHCWIRTAIRVGEYVHR